MPGRGIPSQIQTTHRGQKRPLVGRVEESCRGFPPVGQPPPGKVAGSGPVPGTTAPLCQVRQGLQIVTGRCRVENQAIGKFGQPSQAMAAEWRPSAPPEKYREVLRQKGSQGAMKMARRLAIGHESDLLAADLPFTAGGTPARS